MHVNTVILIFCIVLFLAVIVEFIIIEKLRHKLNKRDTQLIDCKQQLSVMQGRLENAKKKMELARFSDGDLAELFNDRMDEYK